MCEVVVHFGALVTFLLASSIELTILLVAIWWLGSFLWSVI